MASPCLSHAQQYAGWQPVHTLAQGAASLAGQLQSKQLIPCHFSAVKHSSQLQQPHQPCTATAADPQLHAAVHCQHHQSAVANTAAQDPQQQQPQQQQAQQIHQLAQVSPAVHQLQHTTSSAFQTRVHCSVRSRVGSTTHCSRPGGLLLQAGTSLHEAWGSSSSSSWSGGSSRCLSSSARAVAPSSAGAAQILEELSRLREGGEAQGALTPAAVVDRLDKVIVGQEDAKKAVAIAFRNRWRRQRVSDPEMRREITPKNLLLIGPTGCGKTEIARRLAKLAEAPFIKVEATKFTEVGYHGRDVDQIIRDLVETSLGLVKKRAKKAAAKIIADAVEQTIISALLGPNHTAAEEEELRRKYRAGELDQQQVMIDVPQQRSGPEAPGFVVQGGQMSMSVNLVGMMGPGGAIPPGGSERRGMTVSEARKILEDVEAEALLPQEALAKEALRVAEQEGIVFIDEIDKIVNPSGAIRHGSDPSAEGVQRDLLPLIEGSIINTKHGAVATDHILFIASGAFTSAKPSDMMAELQGRLPIRVELRGLTAADFERILTEPECSMIYQQQRLLGCEGVKLEFTPEAIQEIAAMAEQLNKEVENIGARRLHTVLERLVEDISFEAPDKVADVEDPLVDPNAEETASAFTGPDAYQIDGEEIFKKVRELDSKPRSEQLQMYAELEEYFYRHVVDKQDVRDKLQSLLQQDDLSKYIL